MAETIEALERRIDALRVKVREAILSGERALASAHRASLKQAEQAWEDALAQAAQAQAGPRRRRARDNRAVRASRPARPSDPPGSLLPLREQVYEALSLLQVPAAPKLIATVHEAFFGSTFPTTRVTSLKRDEERSFRTAPFARPYYICAALSADYLSPSRGLLAVSTWPLELRVIGSLSPRVDFLTAAIRVAEAIERIPEPPVAARRLLERFAASIPGRSAAPAAAAAPPSSGRRRAAELTVHAGRRRQNAPRRGRAGAQARRRRAALRHDRVQGAGREGRRRVTGSQPGNPARSGLDRLRGRALPKNHDARTISALAANPGCARRALLDAAGVDKQRIAAHAGHAAPFGQSQFAIARGNAFEAQVKEGGGAQLLTLLREHLDLDVSEVGYADLNDIGGNDQRELRAPAHRARAHRRRPARPDAARPPAASAPGRRPARLPGAGPDRAPAGRHLPRHRDQDRSRSSTARPTGARWPRPRSSPPSTSAPCAT